MQGHRLRLGRRRHQSRRSAGSRSARRGKGRHDAASVCRARRPAGRGADAGRRRRRSRAGRRQRHPPAADGRRSTTTSTSRDCCSNDGANVNADDFWGRSPLWAAVEYRNLDMNNNDQDSPKDNGVDRAPILDVHQGAARRRAPTSTRARARCRPAGAGSTRSNDVSWVDFTGQTPFLRAALSGDTADDAAAAEAWRRSEPGDVGRHHAADGGGRRELGGGADLHRVAAGAPRRGRALPRARRRRERGQLDGADGAARRREPRLERHHRAAGADAARGSTSRTRKAARRCAGPRACSWPPSAPSASRRRSRCSNSWSREPRIAHAATRD